MLCLRAGERGGALRRGPCWCAALTLLPHRPPGRLPPRVLHGASGWEGWSCRCSRCPSRSQCSQCWCVRVDEVRAWTKCDALRCATHIVVGTQATTSAPDAVGGLRRSGRARRRPRQDDDMVFDDEQLDSSPRMCEAVRLAMIQRCLPLV